MCIRELEGLDVTYSMSRTAELIERAMARLGGDPGTDREILDLIHRKLLEVDEAFDRPLDAPGVFLKLRDAAAAAGSQALEEYCQKQVNMLEANDLHFKGYTWLYFGNCPKAIEYLSRAAEIAPEHPLAAIDLEKARKRLDKAPADLEKANAAIERRPDAAAGWLKRANALAILGRTGEALESYNRALELEPDNPEALGKKGAALEGLGRFDEAVELFNRALEVKPNSQIAKKGLNLAEYFGEHPGF